MKVESSAFVNKGKIPSDYTADGRNVNPQLKISEIPAGVKTLVLICDDPDAQRVCGHTWVHWVLFDIPVSGEVVEISEDSVVGVPGESTYKRPSYGGPNPPTGTGIHNYHFKVYALDKELKLPEMSHLDSIMDAMRPHVLGSSELVGLYSRD